MYKAWRSHNQNNQDNKVLVEMIWFHFYFISVFDWLLFDKSDVLRGNIKRSYFILRGFRATICHLLNLCPTNNTIINPRHETHQMFKYNYLQIEKWSIDIIDIWFQPPKDFSSFNNNHVLCRWLKITDKMHEMLMVFMILHFPESSSKSQRENQSGHKQVKVTRTNKTTPFLFQTLKFDEFGSC